MLHLSVGSIYLLAGNTDVLEVTLRSTLFFNLSLASLKLAVIVIFPCLFFSFDLEIPGQAIDNLYQDTPELKLWSFWNSEKEGSMINRGKEKSCGETHHWVPRKCFHKQGVFIWMKDRDGIRPGPWRQVGLRWVRQASEEQNSRSMFIEKVSQVPWGCEEPSSVGELPWDGW